MTHRTYFDVEGADRSALGEQVGRQRARVIERLRDVKRVVAVVSGKGGVGKSYVTASLARAIAKRGAPAGVLDADLQSPTVARLLGASGPLRVADDAVHPALGTDAVRVVSTDLLLDDGRPLAWRSKAGEAHVWRGVAEASVLREFLADVAWGALDVLLIDMPPDAGRLADLATLVRDKLSAVAVTIPSDESARSVQRALTAARDAGVAILGVVENMSGYACARCDTIGPLFAGNAGARLAAAFDVPLLARLPFVPAGGATPPLPDALVTAVYTQRPTINAPRA
ncbi:MAG TPA: P-loop NTPase [Gemmatimonadaceae bacterium]|jgi:ATP-binding protein involved in chromosome partitioning